MASIDIVDIKKRLERIFREVFDDDEIEIFDDMTASDVEGWDSLSHITLVVHIEKEFGVKLIASEIGKLDTVGALLRLLEQRATGL